MVTSLAYLSDAIVEFFPILEYFLVRTATLGSLYGPVYQGEVIQRVAYLKNRIVDERQIRFVLG